VGLAFLRQSHAFSQKKQSPAESFRHRSTQREPQKPAGGSMTEAGSEHPPEAKP